MAWQDYDVYGDPDEERRIREELIRQQMMGPGQGPVPQAPEAPIAPVAPGAEVQPPGPLPDYYSRLSQQIEQMPEEPTKDPSLLRKIGGTVLYGPGRGGPEKRAFMRPKYTEEMDRWGRKGEQLQSLVGIGSKQEEEQRKTQTHREGLETENARQRQLGASTEASWAQGRASDALANYRDRPELPTRPKTFQEYVVSVAQGDSENPSMSSDAASKIIQGYLSKPDQRQSVIDQKFQRDVQNLMLSGEAKSQEQAEAMAAKNAVKTDKLDRRKTEVQIQSTESLTGQRKRIASGEMKPSEARQLRQQFMREAYARQRNPNDDAMSRTAEDVAQESAEEAGVDWNRLSEIIAGSVSESPAGGAQAKQVTKAELQAYAKEAGIPYEEARKEALAKDYVIVE